MIKKIIAVAILITLSVFFYLEFFKPIGTSGYSITLEDNRTYVVWYARRFGKVTGMIIADRASFGKYYEADYGIISINDESTKLANSYKLYLIIKDHAKIFDMKYCTESMLSNISILRKCSDPQELAKTILLTSM